MSSFLIKRHWRSGQSRISKTFGARQSTFKCWTTSWCLNSIPCCNW